MAAISKVAASLVSATNENNFGLANINIDFSLIKVEAPVEYQGLRSTLSRRRIENAEQGPQHRTARRLGALFEQLLPPIKTLAEAYGPRASEIAGSAKSHCQASSRHGPFAQHVGFDGASIYAAATSGPSAIAVHLLACLLAKMWSGSEATAIWVELVAERKKDINENMDTSQILGLAARVAAQQEISRADLAAWDASARAWLLTADEVQKVNLTQLRLIIKDSGLFVSSLGTTYNSVIEVWITAMKTLQDLILGRSQRISKGALLVGLSCWHIFPDLNVVGPIAHVKFNDELVNKGGIVTLGLQNTSQGDDLGVQWSLSLSHLRYYGNPVVVSTSAGPNGSRISMEDLHMIALGSLFEAWGECITSPCAGARMTVALESCLSPQTNEGLETELPGFYILFSAAMRLLNSSALERQRLLCLLAHGRRRGQNFLIPPYKNLEPVFGLTNLHKLWAALCPVKGVKVIASQEIEKMRKFADLCGLSSSDCIIRYRQAEDTMGTAQYAYTTAIPLLKGPLKRNPEGELKNEQSHIEWSPGSTSCLPVLSNVTEKTHHLLWDNAPECFRQKFSNADDLHSLGQRSIGFSHFVGDLNETSLFYIDSEPATMNLVDAEIANVLEVFGQNLPSFFKATVIHDLDVGFFGFYARPISDDEIKKRSGMWILHQSLERLAEADSLYRRLPGATVSISIVDNPIYKFSCFESQYSLAAKFACIAMFETGSHTLSSDQLQSVMAMSSGNSIYVANALIQDPLEPNSHGPQGITRIVGNIDHPGVVMLAPPQAPLVREEDLGNWHVINHHKFDGKVESCFSGTSLHLSFTKFEVPLIVPVGAVDAEMSMVETLISTHDQKHWVADLDVVASLKCKEFFKRLQSPRCTHEGTDPRPTMENAAVQIGRASGRRLVSISSWEELLDPPGKLGSTCIGVVRAFDSWHARVATMSVSVQRRLRTVVLPTEPLCTICGADVYRNMAEFAQILIF